MCEGEFVCHNFHMEGRMGGWGVLLSCVTDVEWAVTFVWLGGRLKLSSVIDVGWAVTVLCEGGWMGHNYHV